jgi:hypothetical protein
MKNLFIVTSAIKTKSGSIDSETRFKQTIEGLKSLKEKAPEDIIFLVDASTEKISDEEHLLLSKFCDRSMMLFGDVDLMNLSEKDSKSAAEITLLFKTLNVLKKEDLSNIKRIFKLSARTNLLDGFNIQEYDKTELKGKYVFKKRISTWMHPQHQLDAGCDHLLITRMYSLCVSLIDDYLKTLHKCYVDTMAVNGLKYSLPDTEHAHYKNIDKHYLVEFDNIHCEAFLAGGKTEIY